MCILRVNFLYQVLSELASGEDIPQAAQREEESTAQDNEVQEGE